MILNEVASLEAYQSDLAYLKQKVWCFFLLEVSYSCPTFILRTHVFNWLILVCQYFLGHENIRGVVFMCASALFEHELLRPSFSRKC